LTSATGIIIHRDTPFVKAFFAKFLLNFQPGKTGIFRAVFPVLETI